MGQGTRDDDTDKAPDHHRRQGGQAGKAARQTAEQGRQEPESGEADDEADQGRAIGGPAHEIEDQAATEGEHGLVVAEDGQGDEEVVHEGLMQGEQSLADQVVEIADLR